MPWGFRSRTAAAGVIRGHHLDAQPTMIADAGYCALIPESNATTRKRAVCGCVVATGEVPLASVPM